MLLLHLGITGGACRSFLNATRYELSFILAQFQHLYIAQLASEKNEPAGNEGKYTNFARLKHACHRRLEAQRQTVNFDLSGDER
jgi:hypothetical protein